MSTWYAEAVACPGCGHRAPQELALGVHARRAPQVRARILAGELHRPTCDGCGAAIEVHRALVYTDFERHHWIEIGVPAQLPGWRALEAEALARFDRAVRAAPAPIAALADRFAVRVAFDLDEVREKLLAWDAGLDDGVVECVKLRCLGERPTLRPPGTRLRLRGVRTDGALALARCAADTPRHDLATWTVPAAIVADVAASRAAWQDRYPSLFRAGFVAIDRYLEGAS